MTDPTQEQLDEWKALCEKDFPAGAIENGREFMRRLVDHYDFECEAGPLERCTDYDGARDCQEALVEYAEKAERAITALIAALEKERRENERLRDEVVDLWHNSSSKQELRIHLGMTIEEYENWVEGTKR